MDLSLVEVLRHRGVAHHIKVPTSFIQLEKKVEVRKGSKSQAMACPELVPATND